MYRAKVYMSSTCMQENYSKYAVNICGSMITKTMLELNTLSVVPFHLHDRCILHGNVTGKLEYGYYSRVWAGHSGYHFYTCETLEVHFHQKQLEEICTTQVQGIKITDSDKDNFAFTYAILKINTKINSVKDHAIIIYVTQHDQNP